MKKDALSRKPDVVFWLYVAACGVFAVVTFKVNGPRFPSSTLFVLFLTGAALSWTLDVLVRYAAETRRLADVAELQVHLLHRPYVVIPGLEVVEPLKMLSAAAFEKIDSGSAVFPVAASRRLTGRVHFLNAGAAPAFEIKVVKTKNEVQDGVPMHIPHLTPNEKVEYSPQPKIEERGTAWSLEIRYSGLSGAEYLTRYELDGPLVKHSTTEVVSAP